MAGTPAAASARRRARARAGAAAIASDRSKFRMTLSRYSGAIASRSPWPPHRPSAQCRASLQPCAPPPIPLPCQRNWGRSTWRKRSRPWAVGGDEQAKAIGLAIAPEYRDKVILNYERSLIIAWAFARSRAGHELTPGPVLGAMNDPLSKLAAARDIARAGNGERRRRGSADAHQASEPEVNAFRDIIADRACADALQNELRTASRADGRRAVGGWGTVDIKGLPTARPARRSTSTVRCASSRRLAPSWWGASTWASTPISPRGPRGTQSARHGQRMTGGSYGSGTPVAKACVWLRLRHQRLKYAVPAGGGIRLKPTYGRLSRAGMRASFVGAFDHKELARSVEDLALAFDTMQGWDPDDPVCTDRDAEPTLSELTRPSPASASRSPAISSAGPEPQRLCKPWRQVAKGASASRERES